jgi:hypothetical protein
MNQERKPSPEASQRGKKAYRTYLKRKKRVLWITNEERLRNRVITMIILALFILTILSPWIIWSLRPAVDLVAVLYDKTVDDSTYRQHANATWVLKNLKIRSDKGKSFELESEYYGAHRDEEGKLEIHALPELGNQVDVLYIADTYGVYADTSGRTLAASDSSNLIYGGLEERDVEILRSFMAQERPNTVIAEYNTFGTPTRAYIQSRMYELMRVRWTGWIGQYVADLSVGKTVPRWFVDRFEQSFGTVWNYSGPGFIFADEERHVLVLESGKDVGARGNTLSYTEAGTAALGLAGSHPYNRIFDIVEPLDGAELLATYSLDVTEEGLAKLSTFGLPATFGAIFSADTAFHKTYYLAGNFADNARMANFHYLAFVENLMRMGIQDTMENEEAFFWHTYLPLMKAVYAEAAQRKKTAIPPAIAETVMVGGTTMVARTNQRDLQVYRSGTWESMFVHGVNIGIALPGHWFTEFPNDFATYYRWLESIGDLGANTVRVYTLLDPQFYRALAMYNRLHGQTRLWLMQEIWPEEHPVGNDYLDAIYQKEYEREIRHVIDAIHGKAVIAERQGRAYGTYDADVSAYLLGYLVGRELEPVEVEQTDLLNAGYTFQGRYLSVTADASPTEAWLAESADAALDYEEETYGWQHPVAIVSWPTLDVIDHESERDEQGAKIREFNDRAEIDINHLVPGPAMKGGLFGAYHIYPNYPDFMNNDPLYDRYRDETGRFRYGGYLQEFMSHHLAYPAVVAEFGIATGMGNAHVSPDGYHHGSLTEDQQAEGIIRMFEAMRREGYAGGIIFEWMDEWAKKTWVTEPYMIPYDRHIVWHNAIDPEQNYGLLAMESIKSPKVLTSLQGYGFIKDISLRSDVSYLWIDIELDDTLDLASRPLLIGLDTYARERGETLYLPDMPLKAPSGMEYLIVLDGPETSRLLVVPPYDYSEYRFASHPGLTATGTFEAMAKLVNKARAFADGTPIPAKYEDSSALRYGPTDISGNHWHMDGKHITVRIPWGRINVSDPSEGRVLDDVRRYLSDPDRDVLATAVSQGIAVSAVIVDMKKRRLVDSLPVQGSESPLILPWTWWNQPVYRQRLKDSFSAIQAYFRTITEVRP